MDSNHQHQHHPHSSSPPQPDDAQDMATSSPTTSAMPPPLLKGGNKQDPPGPHRSILKRKRQDDEVYCTVHNAPPGALCSDKCTFMHKRTAAPADDDGEREDTADVSTSAWTKPNAPADRYAPQPAKKAVYSPFQQEDESHATDDAGRTVDVDRRPTEPMRLVRAQTLAPVRPEPVRHGRAPGLAPFRPSTPATSRMLPPPSALSHSHARMAPPRTISQSPLSRERAQSIAPVSADNVHTTADALMYLKTQTNEQARGRSSPANEATGNVSNASGSSPLNPNTTAPHTQASAAPAAVMAPPAPVRARHPPTTMPPPAQQTAAHSPPLPHSSPTNPPQKSPALLRAEANLVDMTQRYLSTEQKLTAMHAEATTRLTHMHNALQASRARATHFETQYTALRASLPNAANTTPESEGEETNKTLLGPRPKPKVKKSEAETKMRSVRQWRRIIEGKDRIIERLEREVEILRGGEGEGAEGEGGEGEAQGQGQVVVVSDGEGA